MAGLLAGGGGELGDIPVDELLARLRQLREDVEVFWTEQSSLSSREEF